jgi:pilus assembly protein Flp/PilA
LSRTNGWVSFKAEDSLINASRLQKAVKGLMKEQGQDLVEYALVVALIAFGATATMQTLAANISTAFSNIAAAVSSNT